MNPARSTIPIPAPSAEPVAVAPVLLDARQTAAALSISERLLRDLTTPRGDLPCVRIGERVLYRRESLVEWAALHEERNAAQ